MEKWKQIRNYPDYQVSSLGRVKSTNDRGNWGDKRFLQIITRSSGYTVVNLYSYMNGRPKMAQFRVHKLVAEAFIPNPENKPQINHKDGDKTNNRVDNLEWCTQSENMKHSYRLGLSNQPKGMKTTKLSPYQVNEIRIRYSIESISQLKLAKEYGVAESTILKIVNRKSWTWV